MEHLETVIDYVSGWEEQENQPDSILRLRNGLALLAARGDPRYEAWRSAAGSRQREKAPVYVQFYAQAKSIKVLYMSLSRMVESVDLQPDGRATVTFPRAPSFYFVSKDQPESRKMVALLQAAAKDHRPVLVVFHPSILEILDVRHPEQ